MDKPYATIEVIPGKRGRPELVSIVVGSRMIKRSPRYETNVGEMRFWCDELNTAYTAGRASVESAWHPITEPPESTRE